MGNKIRIILHKRLQRRQHLEERREAAHHKQVLAATLIPDIRLNGSSF